MSLGPSLSSSTGLIHQSLLFNKSNQQVVNNIKSPHYTTCTNNNNKFSYRTCPICSQKLLVRINGSFVYKWISTHFSTHHHEYMHVVVNLQES